MKYVISNNVTESVITSSNLVLTGLEKVLEDLESIVEVVLDTETTGLDPHTHNIITLQLGTLTNQYVIDVRNVPILKLKPILEDPKKIFIGHNISFDYNMLKQYDIILPKVYDTMIAEHVITKGLYTKREIIDKKAYSLASVYNKYCNEIVKKDIRYLFLHLNDKPLTKDLVHYALNDVVYPLQIKDKQQTYIEAYQLYNAINLENEVVLVRADIEYNGMYLNTTKWLDLAIKYGVKVKETEIELDQFLLLQTKGVRYKKDALQLDLFDSAFNETKATTVNWDSDQQVYEVLTNVFGIYPTDKYGKASSGADALELLEEQPPIIELLLRYRKEKKIVTTYGKTFIEKHLSHNDRVYTNYTQIVDTGRMSSSSPNLQNIPAGKGTFRECFEAITNHTLCVADYSSQESRILADLSNDESFINFFNYGDGDFHSFVATKLFSAKFNKEFIVTATNENKQYRQMGKTLNFSIVYGSGANSLSKKLKIPKEEAQQLIDFFYSSFPKLSELFSKVQLEALQYGYIRVDTITNRVRWLPQWRIYCALKEKRNLQRSELKELRSIEGEIKRQAQNTIIQGLAGSITKYALVLLRKKLLAQNIKPFKTAEIKIINVIHDEVVCECIKNKAEECAKLLETSLEDSGKVFCKKVPLPAQAVITDYWKH